MDTTWQGHAYSLATLPLMRLTRRVSAKSRRSDVHTSNRPILDECATKAESSDDEDESNAIRTYAIAAFIKDVRDELQLSDFLYNSETGKALVARLPGHSKTLCRDPLAAWDPRHKMPPH